MARARALTNARAALATALVTLLAPRHAAAQGGPGRAAEPLVRPSVGVTAVLDAHPLGLVSAGLEGDAGLYARIGLTAGIGASGASGGHAVGEVAAMGRFLLDPLRQSARGVYATGGLALRMQRSARPRALVLTGLGVEGRPVGGVMPALEAGLGGGARLEVVLRPVRPGRR